MRFELDGYECVFMTGRYVSTDNIAVEVACWDTAFKGWAPYARLSVNTDVEFKGPLEDAFVLRYYAESERVCFELIKRGFLATLGPSIDVGGYVGPLPVARLTEEGKKYIFTDD